MRQPERGSRQGQAGGFRYSNERTEAGNLPEDHSTNAFALPLRPGWRIPMALAYRIGRTPPPLKPAAARCWRVAVQVALGQEARP